MKDTKTQGISVTFAPEDLERIRSIAKSKGISVSKYVRTKALAPEEIQESKGVHIDDEAMQKLREASQKIFQVFKGENDRSTSSQLLNEAIELLKAVRG